MISEWDIPLFTDNLLTFHQNYCFYWHFTDIFPHSGHFTDIYWLYWLYWRAGHPAFSYLETSVKTTSYCIHAIDTERHEWVSGRCIWLRLSLILGSQKIY